MNRLSFPTCCGAAFLVDVSLKDLENAPQSLSDFPRKTSAYGDKIIDASWAPVSYAYLNSPSLAYWIIIFNKKEVTKEMKDALANHKFKELSSTKDRVLYCRMRDM